MDIESTCPDTKLFIETPTKEVLTVTLRKAEFEFQDESDISSSLADLAHHRDIRIVLQGSESNFWKPKNFHQTEKITIDTLIDKMQPIVGNTRDFFLKKIPKPLCFLGFFGA